jgi:hypothetical protein
MNIDGKAVAQELRQSLAIEVKQLQDDRGITPGLTVILVGEDPASQVYVRNKVRQTQEVGMISNEIRMPADTSQEALLAELDKLNNDPAVHGILVQLPLPKHIDEALIIDTILPEKDVDGFHPMNSGRLANGDPAALVPCTPQGCVNPGQKTPWRQPVGQACGDYWPLQYCRQASSPVIAAGKLHRHYRPFPHPGSAGTLRHRGYSGSSCRSPGDG